MNGLFVAAAEVCGFMQSRDWKFCIIGGLAVQRWGEPRTTLDVDITLLTGWGEEPLFVDALLEVFEARLPDAREFALKNRIVLMRASNGKPVDVALGALPFEEDMVRRASFETVAEGIILPFCSPEDLFIMKAFAGRPRDWLDAEGIAVRQSSLDVDLILSRLTELAEVKEDQGIVARARAVLEAER